MLSDIIQSSNHSVTYMARLHIYMRSSPCFSLPFASSPLSPLCWFPFVSPLLVPLCLPFVSPFTYLAPSSCDRNRPPRSQVACKLTPFAPPFTLPTPTLQIPRIPTAQRLTKTTSGIFRLLLSGTIMNRISEKEQPLSRIQRHTFIFQYNVWAGAPCSQARAFMAFI